MSNTDLYATITEQIATALESGTAPWVKPWKSNTKGQAIPHNAVTGRQYHGINTLILWCQAESKGYTSQAWLTFKQAKDKGAHVRQGEKATTVVFWKRFEVEDKNEPEGKKVIPLLRTFAVFNAEQIEGLPEDKPVVLNDHEIHEAAENVLAQAKINHGGDRAFYSLNHDQITLPVPGSFKSPAAYYATGLHELTHWTGHKSRLDRDQRNGFGTADYAFEELVAELGAAFLCASLHIDGQLQHAEYIGSWVQKLREDHRAIFRAAAAAQKAADFIQPSADASEIKEAA